MAFSFGEIIALLVVGSWAFGPKELPRAGRALGKLTGQATGLLYRARAQLFQFAEKTELTKVQEEVQATMYQLQAIRSELQGGINILDPGPLTRRVLGAATPSQTSQSSSSPSLQQPGSNNMGLGNNPASGLPFAASAVAPQPIQQQSMSPQTNSLANLLVSAQPQPLDTTPAPQDYSSTTAGDTADYGTVHVIPVSAVQAGLAPNRTGTTPTGSEVLLDALQEERVAHQAHAFFLQQGVHMPTSANGEGSSKDGGNTGKS